MFHSANLIIPVIADIVGMEFVEILTGGNKRRNDDLESVLQLDVEGVIARRLLPIPG